MISGSKQANKQAAAAAAAAHTVIECAQALHSKKACFRSGMMLDVRTIMPSTATSVSMFSGFSCRIDLVCSALRLNTRTWKRRWPSSS